MSRFFHGGDSDSESSSSDEEELYSDREQEEASEEESDEQQTDSEDESSSSDEEGKGTGANRFLKPSGGGAEDSEESEDEDRVTVVKSAKDKRLEELEGTIRLIDNAVKINDWPVISTGFVVPGSNTWWLLLTTCRIRQDEPANSKGATIRDDSKTLHQNHRGPRRFHQ
jgi:translation initiation factor 3 subunit C